MKIIAGKLKGRNIKTLENTDYRPTTGKVKEALFSILTSGMFIDDDISILNDATVLDLYSGSGSLGFEALSRGAKQVIFVDFNQDLLNIIKENARIYEETNNIIVLRADATALPPAKQSCDVVFIDPPYQKSLIKPTLESLHNKQWLRDGSIIVVESTKFEHIEDSANFTIVKNKLYGKTRILILKYQTT